ncbi:MAG: ABC transporter ATP-binding protein [Phycisphaeraceae bacterium]|nr:ABC transporter ATP-binding protein [Phycisphaeraceae bacterium]
MAIGTAIGAETGGVRAGGRSANAPAVVACQGLTKIFKDFWMRDRARAVDSISFEIRPHEIFGLLGPNGSGKSTTIKLMLGLLRPTSGRLAVLGRPPTDVETKRRIGYLPEESYLYPFLNARETLDYYGRLFSIERRARLRRIDELLDMVGLSGAQFRQVREYSKGMQRRIGIAQALINDPDFLILDEPTTGLDPIGTRQVKDLIIELGRRGKTVLLSSHLLADVEDCVDRMVILYGGKIRAEGTCDSLLSATDRMTIESEPLDDATVSEIDSMLRRRSGSGVIRVAKPRQRLEELFLDIVARAQQERLGTSGATHGGQTAAFLRGDEDDGLIDRLVSGAGEEQPAASIVEEPARGVATGHEHGPDGGVIEQLVSGHGAKPSEASGPAVEPVVRDAHAQVPAPDANVDSSVIDSLLSTYDEDDDENRRRST